MPTTNLGSKLNYEFKINKKRPLVWPNAIKSPAFSSEEKERIVVNWRNYVLALPAVGELELEQIRIHCMDRSRSISPLWRQWAASQNVSLRLDWDYSATLRAQRNNARDEQRKITDPSEQAFAAVLMCCDTPGRTTSFLVSTLADLLKLPIQERLRLLPAISHYVHLQMVIAFICKWETMQPRPSDYEIAVGKSLDEPSVSSIPHPNHPSNPSGHSTLGQAVRRFALMCFGSDVPHDWLQLCDEVGVARITCGIHWHRDHTAAAANVDKWHDLCVQKTSIHLKNND